MLQFRFISHTAYFPESYGLLLLVLTLAVSILLRKFVHCGVLEPRINDGRDYPRIIHGRVLLDSIVYSARKTKLWLEETESFCTTHTIIHFSYRLHFRLCRVVHRNQVREKTVIVLSGIAKQLTTSGPRKAK